MWKPSSLRYISQDQLVNEVQVLWNILRSSIDRSNNVNIKAMTGNSNTHFPYFLTSPQSLTIWKRINTGKKILNMDRINWTVPKTFPPPKRKKANIYPMINHTPFVERIYGGNKPKKSKALQMVFCFQLALSNKAGSIKLIPVKVIMPIATK